MEDQLRVIPSRKILQIIRAEGWGAIWEHMDGIRPYHTTIEPLVCWALVEEGGQTKVVGMEETGGQVGFCDQGDEDTFSFEGYTRLEQEDEPR